LTQGGFSFSLFRTLLLALNLVAEFGIGTNASAIHGVNSTIFINGIVIIISGHLKSGHLLPIDYKNLLNLTNFQNIIDFFLENSCSLNINGMLQIIFCTADGNINSHGLSDHLIVGISYSKLTSEGLNTSSSACDSVFLNDNRKSNFELFTTLDFLKFHLEFFKLLPHERGGISRGKIEAGLVGFGASIS
jgi:hypothetical protein